MDQAEGGEDRESVLLHQLVRGKPRLTDLPVDDSEVEKGQQRMKQGVRHQRDPLGSHGAFVGVIAGILGRSQKALKVERRVGRTAIPQRLAFRPARQGIASQQGSGQRRHQNTPHGREGDRRMTVRAEYPHRHQATVAGALPAEGDVPREAPPVFSGPCPMLPTAVLSSHRSLPGMPYHPLADPCSSVVLVVDESPPLYRVLDGLVRRAGFQVHAVPTEAMALRWLETAACDAVVLLPEQIGSAPGPLLRHLATLPTPPAVLCVAVAELHADFLSHGVPDPLLGAVDVCAHPVDPSTLGHRLRLALHRRAIEQENDAQRRRLEEHVQHQARWIERATLNGIQTLCAALEARDPYTAGHSLRVSRYAALLAACAGFSEAHVVEIRLGGQLHDIGKIGVREAVLTAAERLGASDYDHIMEHPVTGWRILAPLLSDHPLVLDIVRHHHEAFDGSGGPDGLAGTAIPLAARVVAVADAFDAMTSLRRYRGREPLSTADALIELRACAGRQFDPRLIDLFVDSVATGTITNLYSPPAPASTRVTPWRGHRAPLAGAPESHNAEPAVAGTPG